MVLAMEMYLNMNYCLNNYSIKINMALPELIYAPLDGGTIHRYEIIGGKRKFLRFIGCYLGQCNFHKNIDDAIDYIKNLKESQKIQKT
jgi:hypothetical protein